MKFSKLITLALFLGSSAEAIRVVQNIAPSKGGMIQIDIDAVDYVPERVQTILAQQSIPDDQFNKKLDDAFEGKYQSLIQNSQSEFSSLVQRHSSLAQNQKHDVQEIDMDNLKNLGYEGTFFFGNPAQEMKVIFDTGSAWAWLFSEKCKAGNCPLKNKKFAESKSSSFKTNEKGGQFLQYGKGAIAGHPASDRACFSKGEKNCVDTLTFLTVIKSKDVESLQGSGLIGLSPSPAKQEELNQPFTHGVPGFIAQLKNNAKFNQDFDAIFSIYLSNDPKVKGKVTFGGYDLPKFAKKGLTEKDVTWFDQSANEQYWAVNQKGVKLGEDTLSGFYQQAILDNGMSFAMAPKDDFVSLIKLFADKYGIICQQMQPLWGCIIPSEQQYMKLPKMKFTLVKNEKGDVQDVFMPRHSYMKIDPGITATGKEDGKKHMVARLLFTPWEFAGLGGKEGEEYWVLGAQFLQNYYTMYDFKQKRIGIIESVSSTVNEGADFVKEMAEVKKIQESGNEALE